MLYYFRSHLNQEPEMELVEESKKVALNDCDIGSSNMSSPELAHKKVINQMDIMPSSSLRVSSAMRKYMTPEPQSSILHHTTFNPEGDQFDDDIGVYTKMTLAVPKTKNVGKPPKCRTKAKKKKTSMRKRSIEPYNLPQPISIMIPNGELGGQMCKSTRNAEKLPISLNHDMHNQRKLEIYQSKVDMQNHTLSSLVYNLLKGDGLANNSLLTLSSIDATSEVAIFEDSLYKYKPGLKIDTFQQKYIRITNKSISVFKDEFSANLWEARPHLTIPLDLISEAQKVHLVIKHKGDKGRQPDWEQYKYNFVINLDLTPFGVESQPLPRYTEAKKI